MATAQLTYMICDRCHKKFLYRESVRFNGKEREKSQKIRDKFQKYVKFDLCNECAEIVRAERMKEREEREEKGVFDLTYGADAVDGTINLI